jgi:hypothetical protein
MQRYLLWIGIPLVVVGEAVGLYAIFGTPESFRFRVPLFVTMMQLAGIGTCLVLLGIVLAWRRRRRAG